MTNKFKWLVGSFLGLSIFVFLILTNNSKERDPASIPVQSENMKILESIPLIEGLEEVEESEEKIIQNLSAIFKSFADRNKSKDGQIHRGTHAKGQCFNGNIEIFSKDKLQNEFDLDEETIERLKQGLWDNEGSLPLVFRFANASGVGKINSDKEPDVRGFAFSIYGPKNIKTHKPGGRHDFMMNSTPQFSNGNAKQFYEFVKAVNILVYKDFSYLPNPFYASEVANSLKLVDGGNKDAANIKSYAHLNYWSNSYTHGKEDVVKYKAVPCDGKGKQVLDSLEGLSDDYLQDEIKKAALDGEICMRIEVQFMDVEVLQENAPKRSQRKWQAKDWVENGGLLWEEDVAPFYPIAEITVVGGERALIDCKNRYVNTRLYSNPLNQPIGSLARVRTYVEEMSRANRMQ